MGIGVHIEPACMMQIIDKLVCGFGCAHEFHRKTHPIRSDTPEQPCERVEFKKARSISAAGFEPSSEYL